MKITFDTKKQSVDQIEKQMTEWIQRNTGYYNCIRLHEEDIYEKGYHVPEGTDLSELASKVGESLMELSHTSLSTIIKDRDYFQKIVGEPAKEVTSLEAYDLLMDGVEIMVYDKFSDNCADEQDEEGVWRPTLYGITIKDFEGQDKDSIIEDLRSFNNLQWWDKEVVPVVKEEDLSEAYGKQIGFTLGGFGQLVRIQNSLPDAVNINGVCFTLVEYDTEGKCCTYGTADGLTFELRTANRYGETRFTDAKCTEIENNGFVRSDITYATNN